MIAFNKHYNKFNIVSLLLVIVSLFLLTFKGLNFGIDFKGGTLIELRSSDSKINVSSLRDNLNQMNLGDVSVKNFGNEKDFLIKFENSNDKNVIEKIKKSLDRSFGNVFNFRRVENVGPKVSAELLKSGVIAISVALALMLIYIWIRFEWQFSLGAIMALFHDVIVTLGIFSLLSLEINLSIIAAVLTIVGYSMNDTVVIFDRVRENLKKYSDIKIFELTNISINETLSRTLITSITTLLALLSIFFFGGEVLKGFSLAMIFGVIFGTYSSIYIANTVLVRLNVSQKTVLKDDRSVFVLENNIAVFADLAFNSGSHSTIPSALFWFGQITNQTLKAIIIPNHIPIPIAVCFGTPDPKLKVIASCRYPFNPATINPDKIVKAAAHLK